MFLYYILIASNKVIIIFSSCNTAYEIVHSGKHYCKYYCFPVLIRVDEVAGETTCKQDLSTLSQEDGCIGNAPQFLSITGIVTIQQPVIWHHQQKDSNIIPPKNREKRKRGFQNPFQNSFCSLKFSNNALTETLTVKCQNKNKKKKTDTTDDIVCLIRFLRNETNCFNA